MSFLMLLNYLFIWTVKMLPVVAYDPRPIHYPFLAYELVF